MQENKKKPMRGRSLTEIAYQKLEEMIITLQLKPGSALVEVELANTLEIGRTPVREAILRLAQEGLLQIRPHKGIIVTDIDAMKNLKVIEVRRELERLVARRAAEKITHQKKEELSNIVIGMQNSLQNGDEISFLKFDSEMHKSISEAAGNEFATNALRIVHGQSRRFWYFMRHQSHDILKTVSLHIQLIESITSGNPKAAASASDKLIDYEESEALCMMLPPSQHRKFIRNA